mmetsp:Transcript_16589/g.23063  ORF Transcript_16589/g.23063 Transcript_16589/m.23063 type:complete len:559 (-) Transcript_16589:780-2456(-)
MAATEADAEYGEGIATGIDMPEEEGTAENREVPVLKRRPSKSEEAEDESSGRLQAPGCIRWFEIPFKVAAPTSGRELMEATAWSMDSAARGPLNQAGSFVGAALLRLAFADAFEQKCGNEKACYAATNPQTLKIYGLNPSSLLSFFAALVGVVTALTMPVVGAMIDRTTHRKAVGAITAWLLIILAFVQLIISEDTWFIVLILETIGGYILLVHIYTIFAYLPDLSYYEEDISHYTSRFNIRQFFSQAVYVAIVVLISQIRDVQNNVESAILTAKDATGIAGAFAFIFMGYAWTFLFRKRHALQDVDDGANVFTTGFKSVSNTTKKIWKRYRALKFLMCALLFSPEAGAGVILSVAVTFMTSFLDLTPQQIGFTSLCMLSCNIPGSMISKFMCSKLNPLQSYRIGLFFFSIVTALTPVILSGPDSKNGIFGFACLWGICFGWVYPSQRVLFCTMIPKGQEFEYMGMFAFYGQILGWLIPTIFTILNENDVSMRWSVSITSYFLFISFIFTLFMGSYEDALKQVGNEEAVNANRSKVIERETEKDHNSDEGKDVVEASA